MTDENPIGPCMPLFIVSDISRSLYYYVELLGFDCTYKYPEQDPFTAVVGRGSAQILLKTVGDGITALPNCERHPKAPIDIFIYTPDPVNLAKEFAVQGLPFNRELEIDGDEMVSFELADPDGYVCQFGRPG